MCFVVCCFTDMFRLFYWCVLWCVVSLLCCGVLYYWCGVLFYWCVLHVVSLICCGVLFHWCVVVCFTDVCCMLFHWCVVVCFMLFHCVVVCCFTDVVRCFTEVCCVLFHWCVTVYFTDVCCGVVFHRCVVCCFRDVCCFTDVVCCMVTGQQVSWNAQCVSVVCTLPSADHDLPCSATMFATAPTSMLFERSVAPWHYWLTVRHPWSHTVVSHAFFTLSKALNKHSITHIMDIEMEMLPAIKMYIRKRKKS